MDSQDENGWSSVLIAAKCGFKLLTSTLIEAGADISLTSRNGESVLYWVAKNAWADIYKRVTTEFSPKLLSDAITCSKLYNETKLPELLLAKTETISKIPEIKTEPKIANTSG